MRKKHTSLVKYVKCTPFGKMLDNIINGDLASLSSVLNVSDSFIIMVQKGQKPVPEYWFSTIQEAYNLSNSAMNELRHAAEISKPVLKIKMYEQNLNDEQRELSLIFADKIENIDSDTINEIKRLLTKEG